MRLRLISISGFDEPRVEKLLPALLRKFKVDFPRTYTASNQPAGFGGQGNMSMSMSMSKTNGDADQMELEDEAKLQVFCACQCAHRLRASCAHACTSLGRACDVGAG